MSSISDSEEVEQQTIAEDAVVSKYNAAAGISNHVLQAVINKCVVGASCRSLAEFGDALIIEECGKVYKKEKEMERGIAFPTCISVNNCICHFSPISTEPDYVLKHDDTVKIDLGAHVDGFIAVVAHTIIVGATAENKITGRRADAFLAAYYSIQAALRLLKPGTENLTITETVQKVCKAYNCKPIEGMLSHQLNQFVIDGQKTIIQNPTEEQRKQHEKVTIGEHEVYALDILVSTGSGTGREQETRVSVLKKTEGIYQLKLKASRAFYADVVKAYGQMPFNLRNFENEKQAKLGVAECVSHGLLSPFQVLYEKPGETVVQFKFTVMVFPTGPSKITGLPFDESLFSSEYCIENPELKALVTSSLKSKNVRRKKKANKGNKNGIMDAADEASKMEVDD